ncbi:hypothetical protein ABZV93_28375 [Actinopolymorpha sp. NPDC004070]
MRRFLPRVPVAVAAPALVAGGALHAAGTPKPDVYLAGLCVVKGSIRPC